MRKRKNYIHYSFSIVLIIIIVFSLLSLFGNDFLEYIKPVNIFSDIISAPETETVADSTLFAKAEPPQEDDEILPCPDSLQCFENYTNEKFPFDTLISKFLSHTEQVRIAWFGDSFTEADLVLADLRDTLQTLYGGNGVGFVPITYEAADFRRTVGHRFNGWETTSFITNPNADGLGIGGTFYQPLTNAFCIYESTKRFKHTCRFGQVRVFYSSADNNSLQITLNEDKMHKYALEHTDLPQQIWISQPDLTQIKITAPNHANLKLYGVSLEDTTGIYIDNFSIKENSGMGLLSVRTEVLAQFNTMLHYDLIVLQFGLNVVEPKRGDYTAYVQQMDEVIEKLKLAFPQAQILIVSVSDRSQRIQGKYMTTPGIKRLREAQRKMAADNQTLFWDLYAAMGGEGSMAAFVAAKPPLANKDYTHLNFAGGRKIGLSLAASFIYEVEKYKKRKEK